MKAFLLFRHFHVSIKKVCSQKFVEFFHTTVTLDNYEKISVKEQASKNESKNVKVEKSQPTRKQEAHSLFANGTSLSVTYNCIHRS